MMIKNIINWILCRLSHDWTCAHDEGIEPTPEQLSRGTSGFFDYAKMYCKRCGEVYEP